MTEPHSRAADPIVDYQGKDARLSVALQLTNDQLLYGNAYATTDEDGLLERIPPNEITSWQRDVWFAT